MRKKQRTVEDAREYLKNSHDKFRKKIEKAVKQISDSGLLRGRLDTLLGNRPLPDGYPLLASDLVAFQKFGNFVVDEIEKLELSNDDLRFFHVTFLADEGVLVDREAYVPINAIKKKVHNTLGRTAKVNALARIETQGLTNWPQKGKGRTLLVHVHALIWFNKKHPPNDIFTNAKSIQNALRSKSWTSRFDAEPIVVKEITKEMGGPTFWAAYLLKSPHNAKRRLKVPGTRGATEFARYKLKPVKDEESYRPEFALRIYELSTHLKFFDPLIGIGDGAAIKSRCKTRLETWHRELREYPRQAIKRFHLERFRKRIKRKRLRVYEEFFVC